MATQSKWIMTRGENQHFYSIEGIDYGTGYRFDGQGMYKIDMNNPSSAPMWYIYNNESNKGTHEVTRGVREVEKIAVLNALSLRGC